MISEQCDRKKKANKSERSKGSELVSKRFSGEMMHVIGKRAWLPKRLTL